MEELVVESFDVTLTTPVYDVTRIKLVSGRIPNCQLLINDKNNAFEHGGAEYRIPVGNYATGQALSDAFNATPGTPVTSSFDPVTNRMTFSDVITASQWLSDVLGLTGGPVDLSGPRYIALRVTVGKDVISQRVYAKGSDCHYLGKVLTGPIGEVIHFTEAFDKVSIEGIHVRTIDGFHVDFLNPDGSQYDFGGQPWILKFQVDCSTDKMQVTSRDVPVENLPDADAEAAENQRFWIIAVLIVLTLGLLFLMG
jgi:hypothetical protein